MFLQINGFFLIAALYKLYKVKSAKLSKAKKYEGKKANRDLVKEGNWCISGGEGHIVAMGPRCKFMRTRQHIFEHPLK